MSIEALDLKWASQILTARILGTTTKTLRRKQNGYFKQEEIRRVKGRVFYWRDAVDKVKEQGCCGASLSWASRVKRVSTKGIP